MRNCIFAILFFSVILPLRGDVYLLRDLWRKSVSKIKQQHTPQNFIDHRLRSLLDFDALFEEKVIINGAEGTISVGLLGFTYSDFLKYLASMGSGRFFINDLNAVINIGRIRYLVYNAGDFSKAVCFAFDVPNVKNPPVMPYNLPHPGGSSVHDKIVQFPDRNAVYVTFSTVLNAEDAFYNCEGQLKAQGFSRMDRGGSSTAGFFMNADGGRIALISFDEKNHSGFVYVKERKK
ncbi:MAG: hypothetical protein IKB71_01140 [Lentisphaeria bacterium]|nr:hypothetical protein [Lentisphaeria bacterium]